jgi:hypothetical protein
MVAAPSATPEVLERRARTTEPAPPPDDYEPGPAPGELSALDQVALGLTSVDLSTPEAAGVVELLSRGRLDG